MPAVAQRERLVERRDAEAVGAGRLERPRDRDRAVAVGVGLDDRAGPATPGPASARIAARLPREGVEVDLEPGGPRQRRQPGRGEARLDRPRSVPPSRRCRSGGLRRRVVRIGRVRGPANPRRLPPAARRSAMRGQALAGDRDRVRQVRGEQAGVADPLADRVAGQRRGGRRRAARRRTARGPGRAATRSRRPGRRPCRRSRGPGSRTARRRPRRPARR